MIYTEGVPQIGTKRQHNYILLLAKKAGYEDLRVVVKKYLGLSLSQLAGHTFDYEEASQVIVALRNELSDEGEYLPPTDDESPDREVPGAGGVGW